MDNLTTTISPLVIDIAIAAIILLVACLRAKAGIFHCVMSVVVIIVAIAIGLVLSKALTPIVKDNVWNGYYKEHIENKFDEEVSSAVEGTKTFDKSFKESWNLMIESFSDSFGIEQASTLKITSDEIDYSDSQMVIKLRALTLVKAELMVEKFVHLILFGVISAASLLLLTMLKNLLEKIADFSIIGWANHGLGFVLGFVEIVVILILIIRGAGLLGIDFFSKLSEGTILLKWLVGGDIQNTLINLQNVTVDDIKNLTIEDFTTVDMEEVGNQLKELINSADLSMAPEEVNQLIDNIDPENVTQEVKEIFKSIDVDGLSEKALEIVDDAKEGATQKAIDTIKGLLQK